MSSLDKVVDIEPSEKRQQAPKSGKKGESMDPTRDHAKELVSLEEHLAWWSMTCTK